MIKEVNAACERLNDLLGISITLPNPRKSVLKAAMVSNLMVGIGLVTIRIIVSSKYYALLGSIGIISSIILKRESKNREQE